MSSMNTEDIYTFYREDMDPEFALVWTKIAQSRDYNDSCDVRLECSDGRYVHSHQSLLSISSECLREAFEYYANKKSDKMSANEELVIGFPEAVTFEELESIIAYLYNGIVSVPESRVRRFLEVSKFLAVKGLGDVKLVFLDQLDNINQFLINQRLESSLNQKLNYNFRLKDSDEEYDDQMDDSSDLSSDSSTLRPKEEFTAINKMPKKDSTIIETDGEMKFDVIANPMQTKRVGIQGRKPQIGSPLITDDFKNEGRYQCKVCLRSYLWKKSLVRHYKELHPNEVKKVTE